MGPPSKKKVDASKKKVDATKKKVDNPPRGPNNHSQRTGRNRKKPGVEPVKPSTRSDSQNAANKKKLKRERQKARKATEAARQKEPASLHPPPPSGSPGLSYGIDLQPSSSTSHNYKLPFPLTGLDYLTYLTTYHSFDSYSQGGIHDTFESTMDINIKYEQFNSNVIKQYQSTGQLGKMILHTPVHMKLCKSNNNDDNDNDDERERRPGRWRFTVPNPSVITTMLSDDTSITILSHDPNNSTPNSRTLLNAIDHAPQAKKMAVSQQVYESVSTSNTGFSLLLGLSSMNPVSTSDPPDSIRLPLQTCIFTVVESDLPSGTVIVEGRGKRRDYYGYIYDTPSHNIFLQEQGLLGIIRRRVFYIYAAMFSLAHAVVSHYKPLSKSTPLDIVNMAHLLQYRDPSNSTTELLLSRISEHLITALNINTTFCTRIKQIIRTITHERGLTPLASKALTIIAYMSSTTHYNMLASLYLVEPFHGLYKEHSVLILNKLREISPDFGLPREWCPSSHERLSLMPIALRLNETQKAIFNSIIFNNRDSSSLSPVWVIHGPPGTGKSELVNAIAGHLANTNHRILFTAHSNTALDQLIIRFNDEFKANEAVLHYDIQFIPVIRLGMVERDSNLYTFSPYYYHNTIGKEISRFSSTLWATSILTSTYDNETITNDNYLIHIRSMMLKFVYGVKKLFPIFFGYIIYILPQLPQYIKQQHEYELRCTRNSNDDDDSSSILSLTNMLKCLKLGPSPLPSSKSPTPLSSKMIQLFFTFIMKHSLSSYWIKYSPVISGTLYSVGKYIAFEQYDPNIASTQVYFPTLFDTVIIDEAGQSSEVALMGALSVAKRVIFAGDHLQLPPVASHRRSIYDGYNISLMERICRNNYGLSIGKSRFTTHNKHLPLHCVPGLFSSSNEDDHLPLQHMPLISKISLVSLEEQYRMNNVLSLWIKHATYRQLNYRPGTAATSTNLLLRRIGNAYANNLKVVYPEKLYAPILWVNTSDMFSAPRYKPNYHVQNAFAQTLFNAPAHDYFDRSKSYYNLYESWICFVHSMRLIDSNVDHRSICIIAPYKAAVAVIYQFFLAVGYPDMNISTVDSIQGCESDIIIYSVTRSNPHNILGFVKDLRRLNVALSRAKKQIFVVGNHVAARSSAYLRNLYEYSDTSNISSMKYLTWSSSVSSSLSQYTHSNSRTAILDDVGRFMQQYKLY